MKDHVAIDFHFFKLNIIANYVSKKNLSFQISKRFGILQLFSFPCCIVANVVVYN